MAEHLRQRANAQMATFTGRAFADTSDHPLQRKLTFIFTDYKPNKNGQGVPKSEASNVAASALYMPIKINFDGEGAQGHKGADPIGPIVQMTPGDDRIIGQAVFWKDEFPEIDNFLQAASASDEGVQFSWELYFDTSKIDDEGTEWLYGITTAGIAIVDNPAYGGRTPLIAIAEGQDMDLDEIKAQVSELSDKLWSMLDALYAALALPGAVDKSAGIEEQFAAVIDALKGMAEAKAELEALKATVANDTATIDMAAYEAEQAELKELRAFKASIEAAAEKQTVLTARRSQLEAAGVKMTDETFAERADHIYALSDELFAFYVADLAAVSAQSASAENRAKRDVVIPDPLASNTKSFDIKDLAAALRTVRKPVQA